MIIKVNDVSYSYNQKTFAVKDASTTISDGEFISIVGHTGSGKSTFIQNLNALLIPTSGTITVDEFVIKDNIKIKNIKELRKKIGIVFQFPEYQLFEETVLKDIMFAPKNFLKDEKLAEERARKVSEIIGITDLLDEITKDFHQQEEANLIDGAYITTFDSFSLSIVKKYHTKLNVTSNIKITDETSSSNNYFFLIITHVLLYIFLTKRL